MTRTAAKILKETDVELEGSFQLSAPRPGASVAVAARQIGQPTAQVLQSTPDFAIVELTCCCGQKTQIKCDYATPGTAG